MLLREGLNKGFRYPADYEVVYSDQIIDTSDAIFLFPPFPTPQPTPVRFTIGNISENRRPQFDFFSFSSGDSSDYIIIFENDSSQGTSRPTWFIRFQYPSGVTLPSAGDSFHLAIAEQLNEQDVYLFSPEAFVVGLLLEKKSAPQYFSLAQNYPNPFNPTITIAFQIPKRSRVKLEVFDILGRKVKTLLHNQLSAGEYEFQWDGRDNHTNTVASGIYFYRLQAEDFVKARKMVLIR